MKKEFIKLNPGFIKDEKGNITGIHLNIREYETLIEKLKAYETLKKTVLKKNTKK